MSDTVIFGKTITGSNKAMMLYAGTSVALAIGGAMMAMEQSDWDKMWWMKRIGWFVLLLGNVLNTVKAFYAESTKPQN